jgi:hypothetical protein
MANTWGELSWGNGFWSLQNDGGITLSSSLLSTNLGTVFGGDVIGWGTQAWGENAWGDLGNAIVSPSGEQLTVYTGDEESAGSSIVDVSTLLLNITTDTVNINFIYDVNGQALNLTVNSVFAGESIFVEISTPGSPTTWGQYEWGSYGWSQITGIAAVQGEELISISIDTNTTGVQLNTTTGTAVAGASAEVSPTGVISNVSVNSVFAGENIIIEVTTPGSPTTWGENTWGSASWGQITGTVIQQGDESITGTGAIDLIGSQINTTTGTFIITADANLTLDTNLLNVTVNSVLAVLDVAVQVTSPGDLPWGATDWGYGSWGNIGGMDISQGGEEVVVPSVEVDVIGQQLNTTTGSTSIIGNANIDVSTNVLNISLGNEEATPNTQVTLSTNLLTLSLGTATGETLSTISVVGVTVTSQVGRVYVSAWAVVDIGVTNAWTVVDIAA